MRTLTRIGRKVIFPEGAPSMSSPFILFRGKINAGGT